MAQFFTHEKDSFYIRGNYNENGLVDVRREIHIELNEDEYKKFPELTDVEKLSVLNDLFPSLELIPKQKTERKTKTSRLGGS